MEGNASQIILPWCLISYCINLYQMIVKKTDVIAFEILE